MKRAVKLRLIELNPAHTKFAVYSGAEGTTLALAGSLTFDTTTWKGELEALAVACEGFIEAAAKRAPDDRTANPQIETREEWARRTGQ